MAVDMKPILADAAARLLFEKKKKKITVKDIVEECNITRQAFYYHFADIPELLEWMISQQADEFVAKLNDIDDPKECIKYWIIVGVNAKPRLERSIESNYGKEIENILIEQLSRVFKELAEQDIEKCGADIPEYEKNLIIRYHTYGFIGIIKNWSAEDEEHIDNIVDRIIESFDNFQEV